MHLKFRSKPKLQGPELGEIDLEYTKICKAFCSTSVSENDCERIKGMRPAKKDNRNSFKKWKKNCESCNMCKSNPGDNPKGDLGGLIVPGVIPGDHTNMDPKFRSKPKLDWPELGKIEPEYTKMCKAFCSTSVSENDCEKIQGIRPAKKDNMDSFLKWKKNCANCNMCKGNPGDNPKGDLGGNIVPGDIPGDYTNMDLYYGSGSEERRHDGLKWSG